MIEGIDALLLSLDIYYNNQTDTSKPVIHGGTWCIGDKANQLDNKVNSCRDLDHILVSVNYRLSPFTYELNSKSGHVPNSQP